MTLHVRARRVALTLAALAPFGLQAQALPHTAPAAGCRAEIDARLAFGLCPDSTFDFFASGQYRQGIPTPEDVLGYPLGSWHTTYGRMENFLRELARTAADRVRVIDYGRSVEHQVMHLVVIASESRIQTLDALQEGLQRLADARSTDGATAATLAAELPVVVWLNAANDGNETAAFEAAMQIAYQVAAGEDARTQLIRDSVLTIVNLAHNPESHERFVAWYNAFVMGDPDPASLEHDPPWGMNTNNNHYQFDLNRDALGLTQTETRAVAAAMQQWRPQVFVDLHGQTTQFFFPPAADPVNPVYPEQTVRWLDVFGRGNGDAFDAFGWSYYTRDVFDLYYPGYWDSYPALHGATGMTYETDGGGGKGVRWRRDDGTILRFADGIARHFVASMATLETAARNRTPRLRDYHAFFAGGIERGRTGGVRSVVLLPGNDPHRAARLASTLLRHGIEVSRASSAANITATDFLSGVRGAAQVPAGAFVIDLAQPNGHLAHTLLVNDVPMPAAFAGAMLARFARNARLPSAEREGYAFYDVTAWNLALAHGVPALWSAEPVQLSTGALQLPDDALVTEGGWSGDIAFAMEGGTSGRARSTYVWSPGGEAAYRLMARLMGEGFRVAVAERELVVDGRSFPRGTFVVRVERNAPTLHERMDALAREAGVQVTAAASAFPDRGDTGTGSESVRTLDPPAIAVLAGEGVGISSYGALWFQLERRIGQPFTALRASNLDDALLGRFDTLILPDGNYGSTLGEEGARVIRDWVERGGTLIAYGGAARWVQDQDLGLRFEVRDTTAMAPDTVDAILRTIDAAVPDSTFGAPAAGTRPDLPQSVPGAFLRGRLDQRHWITTGYDGAELPLLMRSVPLRATTRGANPVAFAAADRLVIAGFTWPDNTVRTYAGATYATVDGAGQGTVILLASDPLHRGVFDAPGLLLLNAIYLGAPGLAGSEGG
jgi:hypothetical protein